MSYSQVLEIQSDVADFWTSPSGNWWAEGYFGKIAASQRADADPRAAAQTIGMIAMLSADRGASFYWSPEMSQMLAGVTAGMPALTLKAGIVPASLGFCWFASDLPMPAARLGVSQDIVAIGWAALHDDEGQKFVIPSPDTLVEEGETLGLVFYSRIDGKPGIYPLAFWHWKIGETLEDTAEASGADSEARLARLRYVAALFSIMDQRIVVTQSERAERATRKRLAQRGWQHEPIVRVVQLRRAANQEHRREGAGESVEWSCSWVVRGHWRQQACGPNYSERRPVFVLPYVKGDPEKPLKAPAERVFAVVR